MKANVKQGQGLLLAYALEELEPADREAVALLIERDAAARYQLEAIERMLSLSMVDIEPLQPSQEARRRLMQRVLADAAMRVQREASQNQRRKEPWWQKWFGMRLAPALAAVALALAAALGGWGYSQNLRLAADKSALTAELAAARADKSALQQSLTELTAENGRLRGVNEQLAAENVTLAGDVAQLSEAERGLAAANASLQMANVSLSEELAAAAQIADLVRSPTAETILIRGTELQPEAQAQLIIDPVQEISILLVEGLEPLPEGQVYQVLLIRSDGHDTAETFVANTNSQNVILVHSAAPFATFDAVGVSIEPAGGSPQRTGQVVLLGDI